MIVAANNFREEEFFQPDELSNLEGGFTEAHENFSRKARNRALGRPASGGACPPPAELARLRRSLPASGGKITSRSGATFSDPNVRPQLADAVRSFPEKNGGEQARALQRLSAGGGSAKGGKFLCMDNDAPQRGRKLPAELKDMIIKLLFRVLRGFKCPFGLK